MTDDELIERARALYAELDLRMRAKFHRSLPVEELLFDRWERARSLGFGEGASIYHNAYVYGDVRAGAKTWIGPFTLLDGGHAPIVIGANCSISAGVQIYTHDSVKWAVTSGAAPYDVAPVTIGDAVYVGPQSVIARGVTIGEHAVIGANSFVNRDVPPYAIAAGTPARAIGRVVVEGDDVRFEYDR
ncbi:MAG TPA: acyltransferase [Thermoanaerobaculia bacterium]